MGLGFETSRFKNELVLLAGANPANECLDLTKEDSFKKVNRSVILNFFRWLIHKITCGKIAQNGTLDKITNNFFHNINHYCSNHSLTQEDKQLLTTAIKNLQTIVRRNGGSESKKVTAMLLTVEKIKILTTTQQFGQTNESKNDVEPNTKTSLKDSEKKALESPPEKVNNNNPSILENPSTLKIPQELMKLDAGNEFENFVKDVGHDSIYQYVLKHGTQAQKAALLKECDPKLIGTILAENSESAEDPSDEFFTLFLPIASKVADSIMTKETEKRKRSFILHCQDNPPLLGKYFEQIPYDLLKQFSPANIIKYAEEAILKEPKKPEWIPKLAKIIAEKLDSF